MKTDKTVQVDGLELLSAADAAAMCRISRRSEKLKEQLGGLLFYLQSPLTESERKRYWRVFELKLREYLAIRHRRR